MIMIIIIVVVVAEHYYATDVISWLVFVSHMVGLCCIGKMDWAAYWHCLLSANVPRNKDISALILSLTLDLATLSYQQHCQCECNSRSHWFHFEHCMTVCHLCQTSLFLWYYNSHCCYYYYYSDSICVLHNDVCKLDDVTAMPCQFGGGKPQTTRYEAIYQPNLCL